MKIYNKYVLSNPLELERGVSWATLPAQDSLSSVTRVSQVSNNIQTKLPTQISARSILDYIM